MGNRFDKVFGKEQRASAWSWCKEAAQEVGDNARAAVKLIRKDPWKPLILIVLLWGLPTLAMWQAPQSTFVLSLLRNIACAAVMFASLARIQLTTLQGGSVPLINTVREKASQWRGLLMMAFVGMILSQMGSFVSSVVSQMLIALASLISWIPLLGAVIEAIFAVLLALIVSFLGLVSQQVVYFGWMTQEVQGQQGQSGMLMLTVHAAWRFVRAHLREVLCLYAVLAVAQSLVVLLAGMLGATAAVAAVLEVAVMYLGTSGAAAIYAADKSRTVRDSYSAPADLEHMKRANVSEE